MLEEVRARRAIIVTSGYLLRDNQRFDHRQGEQRTTPHGQVGDVVEQVFSHQLMPWRFQETVLSSMRYQPSGHALGKCVAFL
jgi:hypothetical protein